MRTKQRTHRGLKRAKPRVVLGVIAMGILLLTSCAAPTDRPTEDLEVALGVERFAASQDAEAETFVGPVDDALFIGVALSEENAGEAGPRTVAVYLCDSRDVSQWIFGEITGQEAALTAGDTSVDVKVADDRVSGTVAMGETEPQPFTAELTTGTGRAGLYRAAYSQGGVDYSIDWIVLPDGRQRGPLDGKGNDIPPPPPPSLQ